MNLIVCGTVVTFFKIRVSSENHESEIEYSMNSSLYETDPDVKKGVDFALDVFRSCFDEKTSVESSENPIVENKSFVEVKNPYLVSDTLSSEINPGLDLESFQYENKTEIGDVQISDFEKSSSRLKKERRVERSKTLGKNYFDFKPSEMTEELKRDLKIIKSRNLIGKGAFSNVSDYKKKLPSAVQIGTVVEDKSEYYSGRIPKKMRQKTLVDELAADFDFRKKLKEKFLKIQSSKPKRLKGGKGKKKRKY